MNRTRLRLPALLLVALTFSGRVAHAGAEVKLDREFLSGLVEKLPPAPFSKAGQYRGSANHFRLIGIDPKGRRLLVGCVVSGEFRPPIAQAVHQNQSDKNAGGGWKGFTFDVRAAVKAEPGSDGAPKFAVDIEEVKRRELDGLPGALAKILGRYFDDLVTQIADGKAAMMSGKINEQIRKKIDAFKEYGVLREIGYDTEYLQLIFDVTKYRADGIAGYVFAEPKPGTVPLHQWVRPRLGDRFYTTSLDRPRNHPYYLYESIACHVYPTRQPGTVPLNRWRGPREWFYTTAEDGEGMKKQGYHPEAIACFVYPARQEGTVPLYRFTDPTTQVHFYTTHPHAEFAK